MKVLGLIPARGGSQGIPRKNLVPFAGKPLLQWTCEAALAATELTDSVLSTDDEEVAALGRRLGVRVPFLRPSELAADDTPTLPVVLHALRALRETDEVYDAVCLLQPTSPLRTAEDIDAACRLLDESSADSVVSMAPIPTHFHPAWAYFAREDGHVERVHDSPLPPRRQELPPAYHREGALYVTRVDVLLEGDSLYGDRCLPYFIPPERSGSIDTPEDLAQLEAKRG